MNPIRPFRILLTSTALWLCAVTALPADGPGRFTPTAKEVTVFKDGHALIRRAGSGIPVAGRLLTTEVPEAVLGTCFALVDKNGPQIKSVQVAWQDLEEEVSCITIEELLRANPGKPVVIRDKSGEIQGTLQPLAERRTEAEQVQNQAMYYDYRAHTYVQPPNSRRLDESTQSADFIVVTNGEGANVIRLANIEAVRIKGEAATTRRRVRRQRVLTITFDRDAKGKPVAVELVSLEKGIRWIPEYRIEAQKDKDQARVALQATVINDIVDLDKVKISFVVGVPNFAFAGALSPLALAEAPRQLSVYFAPPGSSQQSPNAYNAFSNAVMTQVAMPGPGRAAGPANPLPEAVMAPGTTTNTGDLYVYHAADFTLKQGGRAAVKLWEEPLPATSVYSWKAAAPMPKFVRRQINDGRRQELEARLAEPKVVHALRLRNVLDRPLTTGPAIIFRDGQVLSQEMITYTAPGTSVDVPITVAVNINPGVTDEEVKSTPNALTIDGTAYTRTDCVSRMQLVNNSDKRISVAIERSVPGIVDAASHNGKSTRLAGGAATASWWPWSGYWGWPWWWFRANSLSSVSYQVDMEPGATVEVRFDWHYFHVP